MKRLKNIKGFMYFSRSENRGIVVLILLLILLIIIRYFQKSANREFTLSYSISRHSADPDKDKPAVSFEKASLKTRRESTGKISAFKFDPNTASGEKLNSLGFPSYISARIIKYRKSGGSFRKPEDLFAIYGIDSNRVSELLEYISIDSSMFQKSGKPRAIEIVEEKIEINLAAAENFAELSGIGPVLSGRIVNFRNSVGGFYSTQQIAEVYGIDDSLFTSIASQLVVDSSLVRKIELNSANFDELVKHPYLTNFEAKAILAYRRIQGPFISMIQLRENHILSESTYRKVKHYFLIN